MEDERRAGKPGRVIKALLQRQRSVFDLNLLELPTGTLELDLERAQKIVTDELSTWMTGDPEHSTGINAPDVDYHRIYNDETYFRDQVAEKGIPEHLVAILWKSIQSTRTVLDVPKEDGQTTRSKATDWMETPPTFEQ